MVADCFYGDHDDLRAELRNSGCGFVMALKPARGTWQYGAEAYTPKDTAHAVPWNGPGDPGGWHPVERRFRDGRTETWRATDAQLGWWGPDGHTRLVVTTTDPETLPDKATWYLATNLPRPGGPHDTPDAAHEPTDLTEVVRIYGIRHWIEQSHKQVKDELCWADFQVRSATAIRRHQTLVNCAFSFCWNTWFDRPSTNDTLAPGSGAAPRQLRREGAPKPGRRLNTPAGPKRYARSVPGSPRGSCCTAAGQPRPTSHHPTNSSNCSTP
ncbi:hypothetical protein ABGB07_42405 [Micromonosporaceae bacterium B7E4]